MPGLGETVSELMMVRRMREAAAQRPASVADTRLVATAPAGSNPGRLAMWSLVPPGLPQGAPLVVVLHGCTQNAAGYDAGSGWSTLARRHGFALLYPEQQSANNANVCFNWFQPEDVMRGQGEAASVAQMIGQMVTTHGLDPARVYITGLSAGGAMTAAMLATYPELFAGGAIIAGLPYGAATTMGSAFEAMRHVRSRPAGEWGDLVRHASPHAGRRPSVQIWHGAADTTVGHAALDEGAKQWADALGLTGPAQVGSIDGAAHETWTDAGGRVALETYLVPRLGHGVPLHSTSSDLDDSVGTISAYMLEAGISSTRRIAASWGLLTQAARPRATASIPPSGSGSAGFPGSTGIGGIIQNALRASGLKI